MDYRVSPAAGLRQGRSMKGTKFWDVVAQHRLSQPRHYKTQKSTSLYFVRHPWEPWVKVGIARKISARMSCYTTAWGCPPPVPPVIVEPEMIASAGCVSAKDMEDRIHRIFAEHTEKGEWLRLAPAVIELEATAASGNYLALGKLLGVRRAA